jgi:DNA-directed RNA polymerase specialized sigma24 family protein
MHSLVNHFGVRDAINKVMTSLEVSPEDQAAVIQAAQHEMHRRLPELATLAAISVLLVHIQARAVRSLMRRGIPAAIAEELGGKVSEKVYSSLCQGWPRGNVGAWLAAIIWHQGAEFWRDLATEQRHFGERLALADMDASFMSGDSAESFERLLVELPEDLLQVVKRLLAGYELEAILADLNISEEDVCRMLQEIDLPGGKSPGRRKRPRKTRS